MQCKCCFNFRGKQIHLSIQWYGNADISSNDSIPLLQIALKYEKCVTFYWKQDEDTPYFSYLNLNAFKISRCVDGFLLGSGRRFFCYFGAQWYTFPCRNKFRPLLLTDNQYELALIFNSWRVRFCMGQFKHSRRSQRCWGQCHHLLQKKS